MTVTTLTNPKIKKLLSDVEHSNNELKNRREFSNDDDS